MARTHQDIERALLQGEEIAGIRLGKPAQRRMLAFFLESENRDTGNFSDEYIDALKGAYSATYSPVTEKAAEETEGAMAQSVWRLTRIESYNFGGVNALRGEPFTLDVDGESYCIEGYNGKGKSSFLSTIVWGLTGERLLSQQGPDPEASVPQPVFDPDDKQTVLRKWPPVLSYPKDRAGLVAGGAAARVILTFKSDDKRTAVVQHTVNDEGLCTDGEDSGLRALGISDLLIEIAVLMPNRIPHIRVGEGQDEIAALVKLLGLEPLGDLGDHVASLCDARKNFAKWPSEADVEAKNSEFDQAVTNAVMRLEALSGAPAVNDKLDATKLDKKESVASELASELTAHSAMLLKKTKDEISPELDLQDANDQKCLGKATQALEGALDGTAIPAVREVIFLQDLRSAATSGRLDELANTLAKVAEEYSRALEIRKRKLVDNRLQLKAAAAEWHKTQHDPDVDVTECPLCERILDTPALAKLGQDIQDLKVEAERVRRTFEDTCNALHQRILDGVPTNLRNRDQDTPGAGAPVSWLLGRLARWLNEETNLSTALPAARDRAAATVIAAESRITACECLPASLLPECPQNDDEAIRKSRNLREICSTAQALIHWADWWESASAEFEAVWREVVGVPDSEGNYPEDTLQSARVFVSDAVSAATPFEKAAEYLTGAADCAKRWHSLHEEREIRQAIRIAIEPLKGLRAYVAEEARSVLAAVSERTEEIFNEVYATTPFVFDEARADERKKSLFVTGQFGDGPVVDAKWVANTSWLRCFLWSFFIALRQRTIQQLGYNALPLLVLDDPQTTFDHTNAKRWAEKFAEMSVQRDATKPGAQLFIASCDDQFLSNVQRRGFEGRRVSVEGIDPASGRLVIVSGIEVERAWDEFQAAKATVAPELQRKAQDFIARLREHVEGMMKIMLYSIGVHPADTTVGGLLSEFKKNVDSPPFGYQRIRSMIDELEKRKNFRETLNHAHHDEDRKNLDDKDAKRVKLDWEEFEKFIDDAFQAVRVFEAAHPSYIVQHDQPPSVPVPTDFKEVLGRVRLQIKGRVAAFSEGRVALETAEGTEPTILRLPNHSAVRITTDKLLPVATTGDILLVRLYDKPKEGDLVVAAIGDSLQVGRIYYGLADESRIVLTPLGSRHANAATPIIVGMGACEIRTIDGILFSSPQPGEAALPGDVAMLVGEAPLSALTRSSTVGYEAIGDSAVPVALDGQYVVTDDLFSNASALNSLDGKFVVASAEGAGEETESYFKRLHWLPPLVVLENIDPLNPSPPIVLALDDHADFPKFIGARVVRGIIFKGVRVQS